MNHFYPTSQFRNAQYAFVMLMDIMEKYGSFDLQNGIGNLQCQTFYLEDPTDNIINVDWRNWNMSDLINTDYSFLKSGQLYQNIALALDGPTKEGGIEVSKELNLHFKVIHQQLNMFVTARTLDLWTGFCNDQFIYSELQKQIAAALAVEVGTAHYFVHSLYLEEKYIGVSAEFYKDLKNKLEN